MRKRGQRWAFVMALSVSAVMVAPVFGAECLQAKFQDSAKVGNVDLELNGLGIRKATMLAVKVYVAGLYVPQKSGNAGALLSSNLLCSSRSASFAMLTRPTSGMPSRKVLRAPLTKRWPLFARASIP